MRKREKVDETEGIRKEWMDKREMNGEREIRKRQMDEQRVRGMREKWMNKIEKQTDG